jgi:hypothetical protein
MMEQLEKIGCILPVKVLQVLYENEVLTLHAERKILISIRCPFIVIQPGGAELFPGGDSTVLRRLQGHQIRKVAIESRILYPDLILELDADIRLSAQAPHTGEEMWYVDVPGVAFVSP